ncbi:MULTISPECIES: glycosyltransferase [Chryseobacterium]|uniref:Glycosyltransferase involved in cell wall biosynthesis n=1 Tax=Chryseobacterium camelliae TaxID=1265445 RepID=A0ABU0TM93_9FLAO|nr:MULTISPECIES: glycosyltransferase [Chryseobacterium]MDT3407974.1 glycosyltransferase involved in cell wall biosynthesis [Pseudacidovorax intermedius]MDQ1098168.1 glycosyltransferase involved in cell wall biosynthesis [Chryseobacterium camelliae]MDQ1102098.1 glycosyltransferase involved in cell wall biosynthesis [Chryseobacterium sp. SORGH_AS_1048]MDR6085536.1 glycosyltransferase involved in cell wall biosynthesis [Chryseobacterium sp. SORGH_AS_0909]MDR6129898.1 glycosyltransferase involved 
MRKKLIISAFSNLYTDQRIEKVCRTLHENGYDIELIGNTWNGAEDMSRPYPFSRIELASKSLKTAYFEFNWKLYRILKKKASPNVILYANDLDVLVPNYILAGKLNIPLVFDSHEIFSEMPAIQGKMSQKLWRFTEKAILPKLKLMLTASGSYAQWFQKKYGVNSIVIQNAPRRIDFNSEIPENNPKILLYQGAINPFRGIDKAILAMHHLDGVIFKIAGDGPRKHEYEQLVIKEGLQHKVQFLGKLKPEDLRLITLTADCGMSIEENGGESYFYSLPNKVLDCIQARVPLIMSRMPEMEKIKNQFDVGEIIEDHRPENIAKAVRKILTKGRKSFQNELEKAAGVLCWENEEAKLLQIFEKIR